MTRSRHKGKFTKELSPGQVKDLGKENFMYCYIKPEFSSVKEIDELRKWCSETCEEPFSCLRNYGPVNKVYSFNPNQKYVFYFSQKEDFMNFYLNFMEKLV